MGRTLLLFLCLPPVLGCVAPAHATELGVDTSYKERFRLHDDVPHNDSTLVIQESSAFGQTAFGGDWTGKIEAGIQDWRLTRENGERLYDANIGRFQPTLGYEANAWRVHTTLRTLSIQDQGGLYSLDTRDSGKTIVLPGVDASYMASSVTFEAGGWRELDLFTQGDLTYTPIIYESIYGGVEWNITKDQAVRGRYTQTTRPIPADLKLERTETELRYKLNNPLDGGEDAVWRYAQVTGTEWAYELNGADIWYVVVENQLRISSGRVTHIVTHTLTDTDGYTLYGTGAADGSLIEVDKVGHDVWNKLAYVAFGRIGASVCYWRAGAWYDSSIVRQSYREWRVNTGASCVLGS